MEEFSAANHLNWDDRAELHATDTTGSYRIAKVLAGGSSLYSLAAGEIGDISGKDVVHLQCHIGLDTISLETSRRWTRYRARLFAGGDRGGKGFRDQRGRRRAVRGGFRLQCDGGAGPSLQHGFRQLGLGELAG